MNVIANFGIIRYYLGTLFSQKIPHELIWAETEDYTNDPLSPPSGWLGGLTEILWF